MVALVSDVRVQRGVLVLVLDPVLSLAAGSAVHCGDYILFVHGADQLQLLSALGNCWVLCVSDFCAHYFWEH